MGLKPVLNGVIFPLFTLFSLFPVSHIEIFYYFFSGTLQAKLWKFIIVLYTKSCFIINVKIRFFACVPSYKGPFVFLSFQCKLVSH